MDDDEDCKHCRMDRVVWADLLSCTQKAYLGVWRDLVERRRNDVLNVLGVNDRILYIVATVLLFFVARLCA